MLVVGDGPDRARLEQIGKLLGQEDNISFEGELTDDALVDLYRRASVFALPVRSSDDPPQGEGFGLVFAEAGAARLPVVAGDATAIPEVVVHKETGLLVDPMDLQAIADGIVRLLADPELAQRMGDAGRERALTKFSFDVFGATVTRLTDSVLAGRVRDR